MRIFLVRHGQSMTNVDISLHQSMPDHAIPLTDRGVEQAQQVGTFLREHLNGSTSRVRIWNSAYLRARQTSDEIAARMQDTFELDQRENPALCEQQFGIFDGLMTLIDGRLAPSEQCKKLHPMEYDHYRMCLEHEGEVWARVPLGESKFDVVNRVQLDFGVVRHDLNTHGIDTVVVVCHGIALLAFVMGWCRHPYEWMQNHPWVDNCAVCLIEGNQDKGFVFTGFSE